jgi:predicted aspartyl protease
LRSSDLSCPGRAWHRAWVLPVLLLLTAALAACSISLATPEQAGQTTTSGKTTTVRVSILRGAGGSTLIEAPVYINSHGPFHFIIDTGASVSVIDTTVADQLGLTVVGSGQPVSGVGGVETATPVQVTTWRLGGLKLPSATVVKGSLPGAEHGQGLQGLLGSDILSRFGEVTVNYSAATFTVYQQAALVNDAWPTARLSATARAAA